MAALDGWQKSSFCGGGDGNDCLELAARPGGPFFREGEDPAMVLATTPVRLEGLLCALRTDGRLAAL